MMGQWSKSPFALFLVGAPGVGKTAVARALLGMPGKMVTLLPKPKWTLGEGIAAAGHYTMQPFDGADTVPYNGVQAALDYWAENLAATPVTLFDGDRFSHAKALDFVAARVRTLAVCLRASDEVLAARRLKRGSKQNEAWMKGRATKAERFIEEASKRGGAVFLDSFDWPPEDLAANIQAAFIL